MELKTVHQHFQEVIKTKTSSQSIAVGFSIGTFISILPTTGFGFLLGLLVIAIFKRVSKYGLILAMLIWNPLTVAPLYVLSYKLGDWLTVQNIAFIELTPFQKFLDYSKTFLLGNIIINLPISVLSYFLLQWIVDLYKSKIEASEAKET
ncbi:MAG: DUF2062 domain-containing protein [Cyclobacteriaceae bacterium]